MFELLCIFAYTSIISIVFYPMYLGAKEEIDHNERRRKRKNNG